MRPASRPPLTPPGVHFAASLLVSILLAATGHAAATQQEGTRRPISRIAPACIECHNEEASTDPEFLHRDVHATASILCADCHRRDLTFDADRRKHDAATVSASRCRPCHEQVAESYRLGPHGESLRATGQPKCMDCHTIHVAPAAPLRLETAGCERCHEEPTDRVHALSKELTTYLRRADESYRHGSEDVRQPHGMKLSPLEFASQRERHEVTKRLFADVRVAMHRLDPELVRATTEALEKRVRTEHAMLELDRTRHHGFSDELVKLILWGLGLLILLATIAVTWVMGRSARRARLAAEAATGSPASNDQSSHARS